MTTDASAPADRDSAERSEQALGRYRAELRRRRGWYAAVVGLVVVVAVVVVAVAWSHGEVANTTLHTADRPLPSVAPAPTNGDLRARWQTSDSVALGDPQDGGVVVTYGRHSARGRNALTGAVVWSYTRSDRTVCSVLQSGGVSVVALRGSSGCDQVTALETATGTRSWTRTLDEDAALFQGPASLRIYNDQLVLTSRTSIYVVSVNTGVDYWVFDRPGCTIGSAVLGGSGALIAMRCDAPSCTGQKFCRAGPQLVLRPLNNPGGVSDADKDKNPDFLTWSVPNTQGWLPVTGGQAVTVVEPTAQPRLRVLDPKTGAATGSLPLRPPSGDAAAVVAQGSDTFHLLWYRGTAYALRSGSAFAWTRVAASRPTLTPSASGGGGRILAPDGDRGVLELAAGSGRTTHRYALPRSAAGARVLPVGAGLLVAGPTSATYYR
ncbi:PQQ-like domain-containing protein [Jatrophihabitans endophyticus]|uniref:PQQ-like domain-containing protein n=1 Tax=Jatrophihabitans endophyticus TaxID=1206085 RepID=A0A1M5EVK7_9ACTN|nr:PQQ-binding-like beta-propeller repeat protein [Jatrophihabitans endophyticus]SHF83248.1 PQQ-like domain-containing protein [Jatrophihabitans endophyticus]